MMSLQEIEIVARNIAAAHAFKHKSNSGTPDAFTHTVRVEIASGELHLSSACNAQVSEKRASEVLTTVWRELMAALPEETRAAHKIAFSRGYKVWRYGFWNMGRFCTEGFRRGLALRETALAAE